MSHDRPLLGIALMAGFCFLAAIGDSFAKILGDTIPLIQLLLVRFVAQMVLLWPIIWMTRMRVQLPRRLFWLMVLRTILHIIGVGAMFTSLRYLPLADAIAIAFVMPLILLLLGKFALGEVVGPHRLGACVIGFIGTLFVIQPSFANVGWPAFLPLVVAVVFALFMLVTRAVAKDVDAMNLQAQGGVIATIILGTIFALFGSTDIEMMQIVSPDTVEWGLLMALGVLGTSAHVAMTWSLRFAPTATVAPMQYVEMPIATILGFLVFREFPNGLAAVGIAITIAVGLYIIFREQYLSRKVT